MHKRAMLGLAAVLAAAGIGCATTYEAGDEAIILKLLQDWKGAFEDGSIDRAMALYSSSYLDAEGLDNKGLRKRLLHMMPHLDALGAVFSIDHAVIEIRGDAATAGPILMRTQGNVSRVDFELKKESGDWRITSGRSAPYVKGK